MLVSTNLRYHDEGWLASGKRRRSHSILHCCSLDKNSLSREALGFIAVCFSCDELINSIGLSGLHPTIRVPPRAGRPATLKVAPVGVMLDCARLTWLGQAPRCLQARLMQCKPDPQAQARLWATRFPSWQIERDSEAD